jgi:predicted DNA-binding transcriptional regulator YafY
MSKRESIARYALIIRKLRRSSASFKDIADYLDYESELQEFDFSVSKRTFQRDLNDIRHLYNIDIQYNHQQKEYYIADDYNYIASERVLEAFDIFNALNISERLSKYIHFENRKPLGTEHLQPLINAVADRKLVQFVYQKFDYSSSISTREVAPLALKEFRNRWYLIGKDNQDHKLKHFGLDRIAELHTLRQRFPEHDFNIHQHFDHCFGITRPPSSHEPEDVVLSFLPLEGNYIKSMPLHLSQQILIDNDEECRIGLRLFITQDFIMEIKSFGSGVTVISPESLSKHIKKEAKKTLVKYW